MDLKWLQALLGDAGVDERRDGPQPLAARSETEEPHEDLQTHGTEERLNPSGDTGAAAPTGSAVPEGAEEMINRLMKRLEDHSVKSASRAGPMRKSSLSVTNDNPRLRELLNTTQGAARQILEDTFMLIGDVAVISHDLELISSYDVVRRVESEDHVSRRYPANSSSVVSNVNK